jgi:hypothetical protein
MPDAGHRFVVHVHPGGVSTVIVAAALLVGASPVAEARGPDLVVTAASKAPRSVAAGSRLEIRVAVANRAGGRAGRSRVALYLSTNARWSSSDVELAGSRPTRALAAHRRVPMKVNVRVQRDAPPAQRFKLLACADARHEIPEANEHNNCRAAGSVVVVGGSSFNVIGANVMLHRLNASRALLYKLFAVFGERRLPKAYRGDGSPVSGTSAVQVALERLPSLTAGIRAQVERFLIPPSYQGSFAAMGRAARAGRPATAGDVAEDFDPCTVRLSDWSSVETDNGAARVWWRNSSPDAANAQRLSRELGGPIWTSLTAVMTNHEPISDAAKKCGGPDSKYDVYLWPTGDPKIAVTRRFSTQCKTPTPAYTVVHPRAPRAVLAHEFMHVLADTYPLIGDCVAWSYVGDAIATWAEDRAYHLDQSEHQYAALLASRGGVVFGYPDNGGYSGWPVIFSATKHAENSATVPQTYELGASRADPLDALDGALPDGLDDAWATFAKDAWNRPLRPDALNESFFSWDNWRVRPAVRPLPYRLQGKQLEDPLPIELSGLTRQYYDLDFTNGTAREIVFKDPSPVGADAHLRTWAFVQIAREGWRAEEWTGKDKVEFCRDDPAEDVRHVVLVHSTAQRPPPNDPARLLTRSDKPKLQLQDRCEVGALLHLAGTDSYTSGTPGNCGYRHGKSSWEADAEFAVPRRFGRRAARIDSTGGSGSGGWSEEHPDCPDLSFTYQMEWKGGDDMSLKITPVRDGALVEVTQIPGFPLIGQTSGEGAWSPYFLVEGCQGPHGFIPTRKLGLRRISVALSGNCAGRGTPGGEEEIDDSSAGGTLEIHQAA